jgi:hypothetical protein
LIFFYSYPFGIFIAILVIFFNFGLLYPEKSGNPAWMSKFLIKSGEKTFGQNGN